MNPSPKRGGVKTQPSTYHPRSLIHEFTFEAIKAGAHLKRPHNLSLERWIKQINLLGSFLISNATQVEISLKYGILQSSLKFHIRSGLKYLWFNCSPELENRYPLEEVTNLLNLTKTRRYAISARTVPEAYPLHPRLKEALKEKASKQPPIFVNSETRQFLKAVLTEGVHLKTPDTLSAESWIRTRNILGVYLISTSSLAELGNIYGIGRERVRQVISSGLRYLWLNSPHSLQQRFPIGDLSVRKPGTDWSRINTFLIKRGLGTKIIEALERGENIEQIAASLQISDFNIYNYTNLLKELGIAKLPKTEAKEQNKNLSEQLQNTSLNDTEVQLLLNKLSRSFYNRFITRSPPVISLSLRDILRECGFHYKFGQEQLFIQALEDAGIPLGRVESEVKSGPQKGIRNYYFIVSWHRERTRQALLENSNLQQFFENPVVQLCGEATDLPTAWQLLKKKGFDSLGPFFSEFGIYFGRNSNFKFDAFITPDCPVTIFKLKKGGYFYPVSQEQTLREFIQQRLNP